MGKIIIQAGHWNIKNNCDVALRGGTGAPSEMETNKRIAIRLEQILQSKGFSTFLTDANYNCDNNSWKTDNDLFISLHCDANYQGDEGGGFIDFPEPSTDDATLESQRIAKEIESEYFKNTGIRNVPSRSNPNTQYYYMWQYLSAKTPCVILEMGESVDPHDSVILADTERVCNGIARGICKAFNIPFDTVVTPPVVVPPVVIPPPVITDYKALYEQSLQKIEDLKQTEIRLKKEMEVKLADAESNCLLRLKDQKQKVINLANSL